MPAGKDLIEMVHKVLLEQDGPIYPKDVAEKLPVKTSLRSIRYAITDLILQGKVRRVGNNHGPVVVMFPLKSKEASEHGMDNKA